MAGDQSTDTGTRWQRCRWCGAGEALFDLDTGRIVVLTAMHLDGDPANCENWNLVCAFRSCHVAYDAHDLAIARAEARLRRLLDAGQLDLHSELT